MQATRIIAVRHGETDWNLATRLQGHVDIGLNDKGRWQAQRLAQALAVREPITAIYSSDLQRAFDTAHAVAQATQAPVMAMTFRVISINAPGEMAGDCRVKDYRVNR